ncbi:MAG: hypothetical protein KGL42_14185 [Betaproteobacteria bacterium]|nr:hypothetical protein [Betaproteobacteria bacterium]
MLPSMKAAALARIARAACAAALFALAVPGHAYAADAVSVRPELARPLQQAQALMARKDWRAALRVLQQAQATPHLTQAERLLIERFRGAAAAGAGDDALAARSFEAVIAGATLQAPERLAMMQSIGELLYQARDYAHAATWLRRYQQAGGTDPATVELLPQAEYLAGDAAAAEQDLRRGIAASGASVARLQLLAACQLKRKDQVGYLTTLEQLVVLAPRPAYWDTLIDKVTSAPGFPQGLEVAAGYLRLLTGTLGDSGSYVDLAEESLQQGLPGFAVATLTRGESAGVLGKGAAAARQQRLLAMARHAAAADLADLQHEHGVAASRPDGTALVNLGWDSLGQGHSRQAVAWIQAGMRKGRLAHPNEAMLELGIAQLAAGTRQAGERSLTAVHDGSPVQPMARLWLAYARHSPGKPLTAPAPGA